MAHGEPVNQAVLVVPAGWGPPRRTRLRRGAHQARLTHVELVDAPAALLIRHHIATEKTPLAVAVVLRLLGPWCEATVLTREGPQRRRHSCLDADHLPHIDADATAGRVGQLVAGWAAVGRAAGSLSNRGSALGGVHKAISRGGDPIAQIDNGVCGNRAVVLALAVSASFARGGAAKAAFVNTGRPPPVLASARISRQYPLILRSRRMISTS